MLALRSWGKHLLIECAQFSVRIHFLLFGSYRINEDKPNAVPRLRLEFSKGETLNFYACSVQFIERPLDEVYDWSADVMNPLWDAAQARLKLRAAPQLLAADALLDQSIFSGVGNIIKNEVLHRIRVHPESQVGALPARKLGELVTQARDYSFDFYTWKKAFVLKKRYQVHTKTICPRDGARCNTASIWARPAGGRSSARCANAATGWRKRDRCRNVNGGWPDADRQRIPNAPVRVAR